MKIKMRNGIGLVVALTVVFAITAFSTSRVQAQVGGIVLDPTNLVQTTASAIANVGLQVKELGGDSLGYALARAAIQSVTRSTVNWINSGFDGSPAFVTDLRQNLLNVADAVAGQLIDQLASGAINSPYQDGIATAIRTGYYLSTGGQFHVQNPFTLNQYSNDPSAFLSGDFNQGGLNAFFSTVTNPQNNPYGAYQLAAAELDRRLASAGGRRITELNWADGFKAFSGNCTHAPIEAAPQNIQATKFGGSGTADANGILDLKVETNTVSLSQKENCLNAPTRTPGSVIANRLNHSLGLANDSLVAADEINEIVNALFTQLVGRVLGPGGLVGVSAPSSNGRTYFDQTPTPTQPAQPSGITEADLLRYQSNWQKVGSAAQDALNRCGSSTLARNSAVDAATASARALSALSLLRSGVSSTITAVEVSVSEANAQVNGISLYDQLTQIQKCSSN